ncbi:MAG: fructose-1,6-bisphosphatase, partial [Gemmatimonadetes bacterium]|nr:fructose-1,6-bisphosphatase [Gemmatimonadota bacterium]
MTNNSVVTLERHIVEEERSRPEATGAFSNILYSLTLAAKIISREVNKAGIVDLLGGTGGMNVQGERVQKLDLYAQDVIYRAMDHTGALCCMVSEESEEVIPIPERFPKGKYVLIFDPLDGSSNIDVNVSIGTIFSIHKKVTEGEDGTVEDCLQAGSKQVAAGYVLYGSSTMLVYTSGQGVHGFTLDPSIGAYVLHSDNVRMPEHNTTYSVNEAYRDSFPKGVQDYLAWTKTPEAGGYGLRYIGSLVSATARLPHPRTKVMTDYPVTSDGQPLVDQETGDPLNDTDEAFTYRPGDTDTAVRSIFNVRLNPDALGLTSAEGFRWLIDSEVMPISVVKERYGPIAKDVQSSDGVAQLKQYEGMIRSIGRRSGSRSGLTTGKDGRGLPDKDLTLVSEYWEAPTETLPEGRLIVIAGDELMTDEVLPQGFVNFVPIYDERRPFDAYGRATVDDLVHPQKVINKQWSLILEEQALHGICQWVMLDVPGLSDQITNLSAGH